jgi:hypothetical protein
MWQATATPNNHYKLINPENVGGTLILATARYQSGTSTHELVLGF